MLRTLPRETVCRSCRAEQSAVPWADDGALYTAYGDGWGFEPRVENKLSLGLAKIAGGPRDFRGINIRSVNGEKVGQGAAGKKVEQYVDGRRHALHVLPRQ